MRTASSATAATGVGLDHAPALYTIARPASATAMHFVLEGAHAIEALAKLGAVRLREEALARRDELPQLDVRGPQVFKRLAQAMGQPGPGNLAPAFPVGLAFLHQPPS